MTDPISRYLLTVFGYACELGPSQTARHAHDLISRQILRRINAQHITSAKLEAALRDVIGEYTRFELPFFWGSGQAAIADGTHIELIENNLLGAQHIRYGKFGGIAYHHISDTYIALFSHFIACGVWEAVYILDGLLKNKSALQPDTIHADTHGQSVILTLVGYTHIMEGAGETPRNTLNAARSRCLPSLPTVTRSQCAVTPRASHSSVYPDCDSSYLYMRGERRGMPVRRCRQDDGRIEVELLDDSGEPVTVVSAFLRHLAARDYSPNTLIAYAHDLQHLWRFLSSQDMKWESLKPPQALDLLAHLRSFSSPHPVQRLGLALVTTDQGRPSRQLSAKTVNRILAAVSSFYEYTIVAGWYQEANPLEKVPDLMAQHLTERHQPFLGSIRRQHPIRRRVGVRTVERLPRPFEAYQVIALLGALHSMRDVALMRLMLDGGLRPGEVLSLHLEDVAYGRRRVVIRRRCDHPKGLRTKSRVERMVDLHEPDTLETMNTYVMSERPLDATSPFVFLVGGRGQRRGEPMSYAALAKLFRRACQRAGLDEPWMTPHSLRHTHATRMWEGGMRELTLQKRLGHASAESTRLYTRISDPAVVADYRRALGLDSAPVVDSPSGRPPA